MAFQSIDIDARQECKTVDGVISTPRFASELQRKMPPISNAVRVVSKFSRIESLRGLAAIYVVLHHTLPQKIMIAGVDVGFIGRFGQEAVIVFFLLSGFVIRYSFEFSRDKSFKNYFQKRFLRIYLPLVAVFFIGFLSKSYNAASFISIDMGSLLGNLAMLQDWAKAKPNIIVGGFLSNDPLWSLAYEWWFYMLFFPLVALIRNPNTRDQVVFTTAAIAAVCYVVWPIFPVRILMYMAIWWTGVVAAQAYIRDQSVHLRDMLWPVRTICFIIVVLAVDVYLQHMRGVSILPGLHPLLELRHFVFALMALMGAFTWRLLKWKGFGLLVAPFGVFAPMSYVIYIGHYHLFTDATYLDFIQNSVVRWFCYFGVLILVSHLIECRLYPAVKNRILQRSWRKPASPDAKR